MKNKHIRRLFCITPTPFYIILGDFATLVLLVVLSLVSTTYLLKNRNSNDAKIVKNKSIALITFITTIVLILGLVIITLQRNGNYTGFLETLWNVINNKPSKNGLMTTC